MTKPIESLPVSFKVICVGKEMSGVFRSIICLGFEGVSVQSTTMLPNPTPTDEDKMVILLAKGESQLLENIAKSFYEAGVLTLIISTVPINYNDICDSMTMAKTESMTLVVKSLIEPVIKSGMLSYDFNDLSNTLHNTEGFEIVSCISRSSEDRIAEVVNDLSFQLKENTFNETKYISLILYHNKNLNPPLSMNELTPLSESISNFPEEISVVWALNYDDNMPNDKIRLDAIVAGKNLKS